MRLAWVLNPLISVLLFTSCIPKKSLDQTEGFKFNLPREIHSLDPLLLRGTAKTYVLYNLHRGLFYYNSDNKLIAHGAKECSWIDQLKIKCSLQKKKWSDGSLIEAKHYLNTFELIQSQNEESSTARTNIENITTDGNFLVFQLKNKSKDFKHELADIYLTPRKEKKLYNEPIDQVFSGPYKLDKINKSYISLVNNSHYDDLNRPKIKGVFIDDPSAALNMYQAGKIDFLRYLETSNVTKYPDRYMTPIARLDGVFFNNKYLKDINLRRALFLSLNYKDLQKIFSSPTKPGCTSLPSDFFDQPIPCYKYNPKLAKLYFSKVVKKPTELEIFIPSISSDEHRKLAQWAIENWKKVLGVYTKITQVEIGTFYESVRQEKYSIYRKSVPLKNLTCNEAIETIKTQPEFKPILESIGDDYLNCTDFFMKIFKDYTWLPLGMPYYSHLHSEEYEGYYINMLGQFGLEKLKKRVND
jgi:ABC-type oligopeptide transport system substrate-binding subunit